MSSPPTIPARYNKRRNDFAGGDGSEGVPGGDGSSGAIDVHMDTAQPTRPTSSAPPLRAPVLTAESGETVIGLRWTDVSSAETFVLGRSESPGGPYTEIFEGLALGYDDPDVVVHTAYYYIVVPANRYGNGPESNEASATLGGAAGSLGGLRWELPCTAATFGGCFTVPSATDSAVMGGSPGQTYSVMLRIRGVAEEKSYPGGVPAADTWNIYSLEISDPYSLTYLNPGASGHFYCTEWDYAMTVSIEAGATVTLFADSVESAQAENIDSYPGGSPIIVPDIPPAPAAFDGQFLQMDVVAIDGGPPTDDLSQIVYPPVETRLEHAALDGLRWHRAGHTASGKRLAGFGGAGKAREVRLTRTGAPNAAVETEGTGRTAYSVMPGPTLEYQVIAAELLGMGGLI